jgi:putative transposase
VAFRRPRRFPGCSYRGRYRYLLTFCTANRAPLFARTELVQTAHARIQQTAVEEEFAVLAYRFMPDHLHLIVEGLNADADLRRFAKIAKQRVVYSLRDNHGVRDVWQEGFHDWILRPEQSLDEAIRYVLENPVRAGLVNQASDFRHSGAEPSGPRHRK